MFVPCSFFCKSFFKTWAGRLLHRSAGVRILGAGWLWRGGGVFILGSRVISNFQNLDQGVQTVSYKVPEGIIQPFSLLDGISLEFD